MKRVLRGVFGVLLAFALVFFMPPGNVGADTLLSAGSEKEAAYIFVKNIQSGIPSHRVRLADGIDAAKVCRYINSVIPEKCMLGGLTISYGHMTVHDMYVKILDPEAQAAAAKARELAGTLVGDNMSPAEKIKTFHDYLVLNCEYDTALADTINQNDMQTISRHISSFSVSGPLLYRKAVCDGYASAMMALCREADIACFRVESANMNHAWNYIFDGENWTFTDVSRDDPIPDRPGVVHYTYFMRSEDEILKTHTFDDGLNGTLSLAEYKDFINYYIRRESEQAHGVSEQAVAASMLNRIGMFKGTNDGFELDRVPTRNEIAVMLVRMLGREQEALRANLLAPFADTADWASPYIGWLYAQKLVMGISSTEFGGDASASAYDYATMLLRALNYSDKNGDFTWDTATAVGKELGIVSDEIYAKGLSGFTRGDMAYMTLRALMTLRKGTDRPLIFHLSEQGAIHFMLANDVYDEYQGLSCFD